MSINKRTFLWGALVAAAGARAQTGNWKARGSRILVPVTASSSTDSYARLFADHLSKTLGGSFIVENRTGASGTVAALALVQAPADGHTLMIGSNSQFVINPLLNPHPGYSGKDLAPVGTFVSYPSLLITRAGLPFHDVKGLVAYAKSSPGKLVYGNTGFGTAGHLAHEYFCELAGISSLTVNYPGNPEVLLALGRGDVDYALVNYRDSASLVDSGKAVPIGVTSSTRSPRLPRIPAIAEAGYPEFDVRIWLGFMMKTGVPEPVKLEVAQQLTPFVNRTDMQARMEEAGHDPMVELPAAMEARVAAESRRWERIIKTRNIKKPGESR